MLWQYQRQFKFADFRQADLRSYSKFVAIVDQFRQHFGLTNLTRKQIDKFLWIEAQRGGKSDASTPLPQTAEAIEVPE